MARRHSFWVLIGLALAATFGGCGGGSDTGSTVADTAASKAGFLKQADAICVQGLREKNAALARVLGAARGTQKYASLPAQEELITTQLLPPLRAMSEELGELAPPTGTEEEVRSMVGALKAGISRGEASPKIAIVHEQQLFGPWNKLAKEFGLTTCARIT